jgi:hypothetical protein
MSCTLKKYIFLFFIELIIVFSNVLQYEPFNTKVKLINFTNKLIFTGITIILIRTEFKYKPYICYLCSAINIGVFIDMIMFHNYKPNILETITDMYYIIIFLFIDKINGDENQLVLPVHEPFVIEKIYKKDIMGDCSICLSDNELVTEILCNHTFHKKCIETWFKSSKTCPTCRYHF